MALRHEPFEECRCCDKAAKAIDLYKKEILSASVTVLAGGREWFTVPTIKDEIDRLRLALSQIKSGVAVVLDDDLGKEVEVEMEFEQAQALARAALQAV